MERHTLNPAKVFALSLIAYGTVGLTATFPTLKWLAGIFLEAIRTRSTWPFFQNFGILTVVASALGVLTTWGTLALGLLVLRRNQALLPALSVLATFMLTREVVALCGRLQYQTYYGVFQYITEVANSFALPGALSVAAIAVWKSKPNPHRDLQIACSRCTYDLRGLSEPRCPECGRVYTLDEFHQL